MESTLGLPTMMMPNLALVRATLSLRGSLRNPMPWCSLALTQDNTMKSFSRPWNASTLAISISCNHYRPVQCTGAVDLYLLHTLQAGTVPRGLDLYLLHTLQAGTVPWSLDLYLL